MAKVVVIGAGGLVGSRLTQKLTALKEIHVSPTEVLPLLEIVLFDLNDNGIPASSRVDPRVKVELGDLCDRQTIEKAVNPSEGVKRVTTIHLAALLSGYSEENFDLGMKINLYGTLNVMECVRALKEKLGGPQIYVYASTDYVTAFTDFNKTHPCTEESFRLSPVSYGCQKACNEILISDYTRKGFFDGRVARLSAVIGRPGFSNSISYPYTGIWTQTLEGKDYSVPLPMDIPYPISSLNNNIDCFLFSASQINSEQIGANRVIQFPAKSFTLQQIWDTAVELAKEEGIKIGNISHVAADSGSTTIKEINVCPFVDCSKAQKLGLPMNVDLKDIMRDYVVTYIKKTN